MRPLVLGGGPAGSAAAITLARGGLRPLVLERTRDFHAPVCGGFLGWDALAALERLGVDPAALGARPITRLRIVAGGRVTEAPLPRAAAGLSRAALDAALLHAADRAGAGIERGIGVRHAENDTVSLADGATLTGPRFLATGKTELRGLVRPRAAAGADPALGLRARLPRDPALAGVIELHLFPGGYAGLLDDENGTNLCLSIARSRLPAAGPAGLAEELAEDAPRLGNRLGLAAGWITVANVPYGWRAAATPPGLFRLGDQAAVIASLAGDGVAIALTSGASAASAFLSGGAEAAPRWQAAFARRAASPLRVAGALKRIAEGPLAPRLAPLLGAARVAAAFAYATRIA